MTMMPIHGMFAQEIAEAGYDLALDEDLCAVLLQKEEVLARFDPCNYTMTELQTEIEKLLQNKF